MSPDVSPLYIQAEDAIELAELLEFLGDWLDHAPRALRDALVSFCGPAYALGELRTDLARFAFLLDGRAAHRAFGEE
jgi:phage-related minor tail protein